MQKTFLLVLVLFFVCFAGLAQATPGIMKLFLKAYPEAVKTQLKDCRTCHLPVNEHFLNPYGQGLQEARLDFAAMEDRDSDQDGTSNIMEIRAGSLPGSQAGADEVFVFTNRMGNITFNHQGHYLESRYWIKGDCRACHEPDAFPRRFVDTGVSLQPIAHVVCKGCHKKSESDKAPTKCRECHVKENSGADQDKGSD